MTLKYDNIYEAAVIYMFGSFSYSSYSYSGCQSDICFPIDFSDYISDFLQKCAIFEYTSGAGMLIIR